MKNLHIFRLVIVSAVLSLVAGSLASAQSITSLRAQPFATGKTAVQPAALTAPPVTKEDAISAFNRYEALLPIEPGWTGNDAQCVAGTISQAYADATLEAVNLFRGLGGMQPVTFASRYDYPAQEAALVMKANNTLSHYPADSWRCISEAAKEGASHGNLHSTTGGLSGPRAVLSYLQDDGPTNQTVGHRRWIMKPSTLVMGLGDTGYSNVIYVIGTEENDVRMASQWPLAGYFPTQWNTTRWSYSTDGHREYDLSQARVSVVDETGRQIPLRQYTPDEGYANDTIVWELGEQLAAKGNSEHTYTVRVANIYKKTGEPVEDANYTVTLFDPTYVKSKPAVRWSGPERITTAVAISRANFADNSQPYVHIATANAFPDALVGGAAAAWRAGPVLLTNKDSLPAEVEAELRRLNTKKVKVLGGTAVISEAVRKRISQITGAYTFRSSGKDRYSTSVAIADSTYGNPKKAIIVNGNDFGEAISAANLFAYTSFPIFLVNPAVAQPTQELLDVLDGIINREIMVLNGAQRVPDSVVQALQGRGFKVTVIDGKDKYDANLQAAKFTYEDDGLPNYEQDKHRSVYFVTGEQYPDGLAIGALIRRYAGPVLFVKNGCFNRETEAFLQNWNPERVVVVGGTKAVPDGVETFPLCQ